MKPIKTAFLAVLGLCIAIVSYASIGPSTPFRVTLAGAPDRVEQGKDFSIRISISVPEGYYLYADDTDVDFASLEGLFITDIGYPEPEKYEDPFTSRTVDVYTGEALLTIEGRVPPGLSPGERELTAQVRFRGCSPTLCYRPETKDVAVDIDVIAAPVAEEVVPTAPQMERGAAPSLPARVAERLNLRKLLQVRDFSVLLERGMLSTILIVFLAGLLTSLTPCVWPVMPAVLMFVGVHPHKRLWQNLLTAGCLVAGLVLTYALLGTAVVAFGKNLGFLYQQKWFLTIVVLFFLAMSLSLLGAFEMRVPAKWHALMHRMGGEGYLGAFLAGIGLGLIASPCAGPVLAALLGHVALQGSYLTGFALLVVYGLGMGVIMLLIGAGYGELAGRLRGGRWMIWIKRLLGILLLIPALFYFAALVGFGDRERSVIRAHHVEWVTDEKQALDLAVAQGKPVMMEFTASWCPPCKMLEDDFFTRTKIVTLSYLVVPLRVDATVENARVRKLIGKYGVVGWPTIVFLSPEGKPYSDLRVGHYDPQAIEEGLKESICRAKGIARGEPECKAIEGEDD
jgi:thiol:disulfide interchange protein DsbD